MKKVLKKLISSFLAILIFMFPLVSKLFFIVKAADFSVGDIVAFGSYPQSEVVDSTKLAELNSYDLTWTSYNYCFGDGSRGSGIMSNYMMYSDIEHDGEKFRAVSFSEFRPSSTYLECSSENSDQDENGFFPNIVYWFKYEPLFWRVLDPDTGLLICTSVIDSQPFNSSVYCISNDDNSRNDFYSDIEGSHFANVYEFSTIRKWLNQDFFESAFDDTDRKLIKNHQIQQGIMDESHSQFIEYKEIEDKVFLLSSNELTNSGYGFSDLARELDPVRSAKSTDYAQVQGAFSMDGNSLWWISTQYPQASSLVNSVSVDGYMLRVFYDAEDTYIGVRPAISLDLEKLTLSGDYFINNIRADEENFNELVKFLKIAMLLGDDYDSTSSDAFDIAWQCTTDDIFGVFYYFNELFAWNKEPIIEWKPWGDPEQKFENPDPLEKFNNDDFVAYACYDAEKVDWILSNIYKVQPNRELENEYWYYFNGCYYIATGAGGGPGYEVRIVEHTINTNNEYRFLVEIYDGNDILIDGNTYVVKSTLNSYNGVEYWTYTYCKGGNKEDLYTPDIFQENSYIADIWLNIDPRHQDSVDAGYVESILDLKSISSSIYADALKDEDFQDALVRWKALKFAFDTPKALEDGLSKDEIYETLILDLLKKVMLADEEKTGNVLLDAVSKVGEYEDKVTKYKSAVDDVAKISKGTSKILLDIIKEWKTDPKSESFTNFYASLNKTNDMTKKWSDNKFVKGVGHLAEVANSVDKFYEMFVGYCLATDMAEEMAILLTKMKNSTEITPLQIALQNIINSFNNANYVAMVRTLEFAEDTTYKVMGALFDEVTKASPTYTALKTVYGVGVTFVDLTFNTSGTIDAYYLCEATKNFIDANKAAISKLESNYRNSRQEADAAAYVYAVRTFEQAHTIDLETSISFIKAASEEGLINLTKKLGRNIINFITGSDKKSTYESVLESKDSILYSVRAMYLHMDNAWKFNPDYLKTDYPEMYPIYVKEELSKDDYTPTINGSYINKDGESVIEWSMPTLFYTENDDGSKDAHVLWGSMAVNGVRLREEIGDYSDVLEKSTDYTEGTLKMYSEENFEVFNKEYYLSTYSETNEGNVYTNEAKSSITNPIKKVYLSIPYVREFFNRNDLQKPGLSFAINDATNSRYDVVYKIYRKTDSSDWSHIDTVDRVLSPFSNSMVYTDTTAVAGEKYSYKVSSYSTFENGKTLHSDFSDVFSAKDSTGKFIENEIDFRFVDPRKNILSKNSKLSQAVSLEESPHIEITWNDVENAEFYEIYRISSYGSSYKLIATVDGENCSYSDYDLDNGVAYEYAIISGYKGEKDGKAYEYSDMSIGEIEFDLGDVYSITWITDDRTYVKENVEGDKITAPNVSVEDGYRFIGWTPEVPDVMPAEDLTFIAVFEEINTDNSDEPTKPTEPSTKPSEPTTKPVVTVPVPSVEIRRPSQTEIKYGDSIILHADVENLPEGAYIEWTADNGNFKMVSYSADGSSCTVTPEASGDTTFTAIVYDKDGNEIGSDSQTMTAKAGFFQKLIAFFKKLFGLTKVIPEIFKR